jgi:hypothetical protein
MTIKNNGNPYKTSETWIVAYTSGSYSDLEAFENYSSQFFYKVNDPNIEAEKLISTLCINTFSAIAVSALADPRGGNEEEEKGQVHESPRTFFALESKTEEDIDDNRTTKSKANHFQNGHRD